MSVCPCVRVWANCGGGRLVEITRPYIIVHRTASAAAGDRQLTILDTHTLTDINVVRQMPWEKRRRLKLPGDGGGGAGPVDDDGVGFPS